MEVVARRGFDATVDDIARESGVSARTIFRHYGSHDQLIVETVKDIYAACGRRPIEGLPRPEDDVDGWLEGLAATVHQRNADILGEAFWDVHLRHGSQSLLAEVAALRRDFRLRGVRYLAEQAWHHAGGAGDPPEDLVLAFALNFSAFATQALMVDFDQSPETIGALTAEILKERLRRAMDGRSREPEGDTTGGPGTGPETS